MHYYNFCFLLKMSEKYFKELDATMDLPRLEREMLEYWKSIDILNYTYKSREKSPKKIYYDGPITANGLPHYGHAITWTMKDVVPRFWTMQGNYVTRNMGWDCQGILVEYEVEKTLGFKNKKDVATYGIEKFNNACKESVLKYRALMLEHETRLGRLIDHDAEYATMDSKYIESMWWALKDLYNKGLLYEGYKVVAYSTRSGMTLSTHEVAEGGYDEVIDQAVTIKFKVADEDKTYFLAWTTTPWTLPGNLLIAVGKKLKYVKVKIDDECFILAENALERVFGDSKYNVIQKYTGNELVGLKYEPLFNYFEDRSKEGAFVVVHGNHVTTEEGTGIVHLAPYGMEDFDILLGLKISLFDYLDEEGTFNSLTPELEGLFYKKANLKIIELLSDRNLIYKSEDYPHQMPLDYRTKTPLIYKPIKSWYVNVEKLKPQLLEISKSIKFVPKSEGNRFRAWIENARDWSLSRKRFWGTPLPIWVNDKTNEIKFIGSFSELEEASKKTLGKEFDPHKPYVDDITWEGDNGGIFRRIPEVIDVWFDSGSMPYAQHHYPFENKDKFLNNYPADFISEGDDQIRLWFYTMYVLGCALFKNSPFNNVVVIGMLGDEKGKKMSKSKGNYPPIDEVFNNYGSDMFRYFLLTSPIVQGESARFSYDLIQETKKEFFTMLWNSYKYFITYANSNDYKPSLTKPTPENVLDKWILARLKQSTLTMSSSMNDYHVMDAARQLRPLVSDLSTWYIRRSRDRISSGDKQALDTLYFVLVELTKLCAPFMPLLSDYLYKSLNAEAITKLKSVHVDHFFDFEKMSLSEMQLIKKMGLTRQIVTSALSIRSENEIKVRQPLQTIFVIPVKENDLFGDVLKEEVNVKEILFTKPKGKTSSFEDQDYTISLTTDISPKLEVEGTAREIVRTVQALRKENGLSVEDKINITYKNTPENVKAFEMFGDEIKLKISAVKIEPGSDFTVTKIN